MPPCLQSVSGNIGDITLRALEVLKSADVIYSEDTRVTRKLLTLLKVESHAQIESFHSFNEHGKIEGIIETLKTRTQTSVMVSDAGTPSISDPGYLLTRACIANNITVEVNTHHAHTHTHTHTHTHIHTHTLALSSVVPTLLLCVCFYH